MLRLSPPHLVLIMIGASCGAYLTSIMLSPVYFGMAAAMGLTILLFAANHFRPNAAEWLGFSFWLAVLVAQSLLAHLGVFRAWNVSSAINFVLGPICFFMVTCTSRAASKRVVRMAGRVLVYVALVLATAEATARFGGLDWSKITMAIDDGNWETAFYSLKYGSIMYEDSNFVGLQIGIVLAFMMALRQARVMFPHLVWIALMVLLCLTLSRASILAFGVVGLAYLASLSRLKNHLMMTIPLAIVAVVPLVAQDLSFLSKFYVLDAYWRYLEETDLVRIFLGEGFGAAFQIIGMGSHNIVVTYGLEAGWFLSGAVVIFWLWQILRLPGVWLLVLSWMVNGFSLTTFAVPYLYVAAALLTQLPVAGNSEHRLEAPDTKSTPPRAPETADG